MREIKFKAKSTVNKQWLYGYYEKGLNGLSYIKNKVAIDENSNKAVDSLIIPETLCQFVGSTFDNKDYYFNDILEHDDGYLCVVKYGEHYIFDNEHSGYGYYIHCLSDDGDFHCSIEYGFDGKIVGNTIEDSELIKNK